MYIRSLKQKNFPSSPLRRAHFQSHKSMRWITLATLMMESFPDEGDDPSGRENPSSDDLEQKTVAKKSAAKRPKRTRRPPAIPWKKPKDMPKRPLSAYNLFFQHERQRILSEAQEVEVRAQEASRTHESMVSQEIGQMQQLTVTESSQNEASRRHLKSSGIGFANLGKAIGAKWKDLDPALKAPFEAQAAKEKERYDKEMSGWRAQKKLEKAAAGSEEDSTQRSRQQCVASNVYTDVSQYATQGSQSDPYPSSWFQISPNPHHVPGTNFGFPRSHPTLREGLDDNRLQQLPVAAPLPVFSNSYAQRRHSLPGTMNVHMSSDEQDLHARRGSAPYFPTGTFSSDPSHMAADEHNVNFPRLRTSYFQPGQYTMEFSYGQHPPSPESVGNVVQRAPVPMEEPLIQPHPDALAEFSVLYSTPSTSETDKSSPGSTNVQQEMLGEVRTFDEIAHTMPTVIDRHGSQGQHIATQSSIRDLSSSLDQEEVEFFINLPFDKDTP